MPFMNGRPGSMSKVSASDGAATDGVKVGVKLLYVAPVAGASLPEGTGVRPIFKKAFLMASKVLATTICRIGASTSRIGAGSAPVVAARAPAAAPSLPFAAASSVAR